MAYMPLTLRSSIPFVRGAVRPFLLRSFVLFHMFSNPGSNVITEQSLQHNWCLISIHRLTFSYTVGNGARTARQPIVTPSLTYKLSDQCIQQHSNHTWSCSSLLNRFEGVGYPYSSSSSDMGCLFLLVRLNILLPSS